MSLPWSCPQTGRRGPCRRRCALGGPHWPFCSCSTPTLLTHTHQRQEVTGPGDVPTGNLHPLLLHQHLSSQNSPQSSLQRAPRGPLRPPLLTLPLFSRADTLQERALPGLMDGQEAAAVRISEF